MTNYIVDVAYNNGEVALFGPFPATRLEAPFARETAIEFITRIKNAKDSCVTEARIRVLNNA